MSGLPMTPGLMYDEIKSAREVLSRWEEVLAGPLPSVDAPGSEEDLLQLLRELTGELLIVSNKVNGLSVVLSDRLVQ